MIQSIIRPSVGTPKRGEVKQACEALAAMFHGEFCKITSYGQSTPYLLYLKLPGQSYNVCFNMGTNLESTHKALEQVVILLNQARLLASPNKSELIIQPYEQEPT